MRLTYSLQKLALFYDSDILCALRYQLLLLNVIGTAQSLLSYSWGHQPILDTQFVV